MMVDGENRGGHCEVCRAPLSTPNAACYGRDCDFILRDGWLGELRFSLLS